MAIKKIITVPESSLRQKSKPVKKIDQKIKNLARDLADTVTAAKEPRGVGLSAIQIKKPIRIFVIKKGKKFVPFVNPKIVWQSKKSFSQVLDQEKLFLEGCLSIPGFYGFVDRPSEIELVWQDLKGKAHQEKFADRQSAYIQHELDHLNGILFIDRVLTQKGKIFKLEKDKKGEQVMVEAEVE
ncbi:MAG TPA: peptide deformylase [Candidatus Bathyarchaeia archaeon]|nr:peptide deformylase [Candidatus Bathyarchaeia archaeon]